MSSDACYDVIIIGGGILGFSTAMQLKEKYPNYHIAVIEKESKAGMHQTGHNSGVMHAGVYYTPGSLKATFCKEGLKDTTAFCDKHSIPYKSSGKLIVATNNAELERMKKLIERSELNGLNFSILNESELKQCQPGINGLKAIYVRESKIISWKKVTEKYSEVFSELGGAIFYKQTVTSINETDKVVEVRTKEGLQLIAKNIIICAGLMADRMVSLMGVKPDFKIIPFRGEYFKLNDKYNNKFKHLIYPVPDPDLPFLGVHLTLMIDGTVTVGPNAVLAFSREGYKRCNINLKDCFELFCYPAFWKMLVNNFKPMMHELKTSSSKKSYLKLINKYCPEIRLDDLEPYPAGVRAQALSKNGKLIDDFLFFNTKRSLHVCNAPSPAASSSLPIGKYVIEKFENIFSV